MSTRTLFAAATSVAQGMRHRIDRHVFVCGMERSGTTVLGATLESQPSFGSRTTVSPETRVFEQPEILCDESSIFGRAALGYIDDDMRREQVSELARIVCRIASIGARGGATPSGELISRLRWEVHRALLRAYFDTAARSNGCRRLVEQTPRHVRHVDQILSAFPNAKVIVMTRHPVDVLASIRKRGRAVPEQDRGLLEHSWLFVDTVQFADDCRLNVAYALGAVANHPEDVRILQYEQLSTHPEVTLRSLLRWLGTELDLHAYRSRDQQTSDAAPFHDARALLPIEPAATDWRDFISVEEASEVEILLGPDLARLGYSRRT